MSMYHKYVSNHNCVRNCSYFPSGRPFLKESLSSSLVLPDDFMHTSIDGHDNTRAYQSLIANCRRSEVMWLACSGGKLHSRAVQGGRTRTGEPIYIARARSPEWNMCLGESVLHLINILFH